MHPRPRHARAVRPAPALGLGRVGDHRDHRGDVRLRGRARPAGAGAARHGRAALGVRRPDSRSARPHRHRARSASSPGMPNASVDNLLGPTDEAIAKIADRLPVAAARRRVAGRMADPHEQRARATCPTAAILESALKLAIDLGWEDRVTFVEGAAPAAVGGRRGGRGHRGRCRRSRSRCRGTAADLMEVEVGDVIGFHPSDLLVAGIYDLVDPDDPYWAHASDLAARAASTRDRQAADRPRVGLPRPGVDHRAAGRVLRRRSAVLGAARPRGLRLRRRRPLSRPRPVRPGRRRWRCRASARSSSAAA